MGMAKKQFMEEEERGFSSINKRVCKYCVQDDVLIQYVICKGDTGICDYCKDEANCIGLEQLMVPIMDGINFKYSRAIEEFGRNNGEFCGKTYDKSDIIDELLCGVVTDEVLKDISEIIEDETWCERDPYGMQLSDEQSCKWHNFSEMVKRRNRYMFFKTLVDSEKSNYVILDKIARAIEDFDLYKIVPKNNMFYRGRMHDSKTTYSNPKELCSPPHENAKSNRMSAEGISVFYGANDIDTAVAEIFTSAYSCATVAAFKNLRKLVILDLTLIRTIPIPSVFDVAKRDLIEPLFFLRELLDDLTRPIETMHSIEYIPAQIIAEYFRYCYKYKKKQVDGIAYGSSKQKNGICYVLFAEHDQCFPRDKSSYNFKLTDQMLEMEKGTLSTYEVESHTILKKYSKDDL